MKEYSKRVVRAIILLWFAGAVFGAAIVTAQLWAAFMQLTAYGVGVTVNLPELLAYIGAPVTGGIIGYMCKSTFENREKIKKGVEIPPYNNNFDRLHLHTKRSNIPSSYRKTPEKQYKKHKKSPI